MDRKSEDETAPDAQSPALGLALNAAQNDASIAADARTYLREQARLVRLQAEQLIEEAALTRWSLRLKHAGEMMKFAFELAVALLIFAVVAGLAAACWSAAHDNGLVIEGFSVPPDFAQRGLTGQVVASQLLDKLTRMQDETNSVRAADTYRSNWGDDIKVEIPDTGISIGELNRVLRNWLGHETHITGEVWRTPSGIALTARAGDAGVTFAGTDSDFNLLLQKAAESIYNETQPYRYAAFLGDQSRQPEAEKVLEKLAVDAPPSERAWADSFLGSLFAFEGRTADSLAVSQAAVVADPANAHAWDNLASREQSLDRLENGYWHTRKALALYDSGSVAFNPGKVVIIKYQDRAFLASVRGDFISAMEMDEGIRSEPDHGGSQEQALADEAAEAASDHDPERAAQLLSQDRPATTDQRLTHWITQSGVALENQQWAEVIRLIDRDRLLGSAPASYRAVLTSIFVRVPTAWLATAKAMTGDIAGARRLIGTTPLDCYDCLIARAKIDAAARRWDASATWFAFAARTAPSLPAAYTDWGAMLLAKGDTAGAISKFSVAADKGPRFADPLEMWGEALIRENRSDLALAKFAAAQPFAPHWGRLHLEWGEALIWLGRKADAQAHFARASALALSASDRNRLKALERRS